MKIAFVGSFSRLYDEEGMARALEALGHEVARYEEIAFGASDGEHIVHSRPDLLLFAKLKIPVVLASKLLGDCKNAGIRTVCYMPDLYWGLGREASIKQKNPIFRADLVCSPDGGHDQEWKDNGIRHCVVRQGIPESECRDGTPISLPYEIVFVGTQNGEFQYRTDLMRRLSIKYGERFHWVGRHYAKECRGKDLNDLYATVKIVVGDSVFSPYYWSNRIYETLGRGGFLIHPVVPGLDKEFSYYEHFVPYHYGDFDGLCKKIDYYASHPEEREKIRKAGQQHVRDNYTTLHRAKELIDHANALR